MHFKRFLFGSFVDLYIYISIKGIYREYRIHIYILYIYINDRIYYLLNPGKEKIESISLRLDLRIYLRHKSIQPLLFDKQWQHIHCIVLFKPQPHSLMVANLGNDRDYGISCNHKWQNIGTHAYGILF